MAFKTYKPKGELVSKEYTVEEVYQDIPTYTKKDKVLIVDMDIMCYKVSSVCEYKYHFTCKDSGEVFNVKSKKSFKDYCLENDLNYDNFDCINEQTAEPKSYAFRTISDALE